MNARTFSEINFRASGFFISFFGFCFQYKAFGAVGLFFGQSLDGFGKEGQSDPHVVFQIGWRFDFESIGKG